MSPSSRVLTALSALALISAYYLPIWQILLWAPQYPEGIGMQIWIDHLTGDIASINKMNFYIGMGAISEEMFPEFLILKYVVAVIIAIGLIAAITGKRTLLGAYAVILILFGIAALVDMYLWGYDYGHNLDPTAAIKIPDMSYQPPLIGYEQLLNFLAYSGPDTAGWIMGGSAFVAVMTWLYELGLFKKLRRKL